jgi:hypothetical protein
MEDRVPPDYMECTCDILQNGASFRACPVHDLDDFDDQPGIWGWGDHFRDNDMSSWTRNFQLASENTDGYRMRQAMLFHGHDQDRPEALYEAYQDMGPGPFPRFLFADDDNPIVGVGWGLDEFRVPRIPPSGFIEQ